MTEIKFYSTAVRREIDAIKDTENARKVGAFVITKIGSGVRADYIKPQHLFESSRLNRFLLVDGAWREVYSAEEVTQLLEQSSRPPRFVVSMYAHGDYFNIPVSYAVWDRWANKFAPMGVSEDEATAQGVAEDLNAGRV